MLTVGNQSCAANPPSNANAKNRDAFIAEKTNDRSDSDCPKVRNLLRMKKAINTLVASNNRAEKNYQDNDDPGEVLDAAIAEGKPLGGALTRKKKCNAQWYGRRRISKIMNGIRQQPDAA